MEQLKAYRDLTARVEKMERAMNRMKAGSARTKKAQLIGTLRFALLTMRERLEADGVKV